MKVESVDVAQLDVVTELPDLRRDLHVFVDQWPSKGLEINRIIA